MGFTELGAALSFQCCSPDPHICPSPASGPELGPLRTLTCFYVVGISRVPQPLQSWEENKFLCFVKNITLMKQHAWLPCLPQSPTPRGPQHKGNGGARTQDKEKLEPGHSWNNGHFLQQISFLEPDLVSATYSSWRPPERKFTIPGPWALSARQGWVALPALS